MVVKMIKIKLIPPLLLFLLVANPLYAKDLARDDSKTVQVGVIAGLLDRL